MKLSNLETNKYTQVKDTSKLGKELSNILRLRGIYKGAEVQVKRRIYGGRLLILETNGIELCIRGTDAQKIEVL